MIPEWKVSAVIYNAVNTEHLYSLHWFFQKQSKLNWKPSRKTKYFLPWYPKYNKIQWEITLIPSAGPDWSAVQFNFVQNETYLLVSRLFSSKITMTEALTNGCGLVSTGQSGIELLCLVCHILSACISRTPDDWFQSQTNSSADGKQPLLCAACLTYWFIWQDLPRQRGASCSSNHYLFLLAITFPCGWCKADRPSQNPSFTSVRYGETPK